MGRTRGAGGESAPMRPNLKLHRENLVDLTSDELAGVDGGVPWTPWCHVTIELTDKITEPLTTRCR